MSVTIVNGGSVQAGVSSNGLTVEVAVSQSNGSVVVVGGGGNGGPVQISGPSPGSQPVSVSSGVQSTNAVQVQLSPGIGPSIVVNGTSTSIVGTAGINPFIAGDNITITTTGGGITVIGRDPPVLSVNGRTGSVVLSVVDLTAAQASHTHAAGDIADFSSAVAAASPVQSVAGRVGNVTLTTTDISQFTTGVRTFSRVQSVSGRTGAVSLTTTDISGLTAAIQAFSKVSSVQGKSGDVTLTVSDITAAAASHTHSISEVGLSASDLVPPQLGQTGKYLKSVDGVAAWAAVPTGGGGGGGGGSSGGLFFHWFGSQPTLSLSVPGGTGGSVAISGYERVQSGSGAGYFKITGVSVASGGSGYTDYTQVIYTLGENDESADSLNLRIRTFLGKPPEDGWTLEKLDGSPGSGLAVSMGLERRATWPGNYPEDTYWKAVTVTPTSGGTGYRVGDRFYASGPTTLQGWDDAYYKVWLTVSSVDASGSVTGIVFTSGLSDYWKGGRHVGVGTGEIALVEIAAPYSGASPSYGLFLKNDGSGTSFEEGEGKYRFFVFPPSKSLSVTLPPAAPGTELYVINGSASGATLSLVDGERSVTYSLANYQDGYWPYVVQTSWIFLVSAGVESGWYVLGRGLFSA